MSFLAKLQQLKQSAKVPEPGKSGNDQKKPEVKSLDSSRLLPKNYVREVDPAIKRLKEARRLKQGVLETKTTKSTSKTRHKDSSPKSELPVYKKKPGSNTATAKPVYVPKKEPIKKLSFEELMKRAEQKPKTVQNESSRPKPVDIKKAGFKSRTNSRSPSSSSRSVQRVEKPTPKSHHEHNVHKRKVVVESFSRIAQPNEKLAKKLKLKERRNEDLRRRNQIYDSEDEDLSDFIEDDEVDRSEDTSNGVPYDRDEIWSIFNKGGRRRYYDYDDEDDDMEANEMEILEEEEMAAKMARLEDKKEEAWLKKHEAEKKRLKKNHS